MALLFLCFGAQLAAAQEAGDRRIVTTRGADYFGGDYDILKDVDLDLCSSACLGDRSCKAFTLNSKTGWCFLKSTAGELRTVNGAVSGKVVALNAVSESSVDARRADLDFLPSATLDAAKQLRLQIADEERNSAYDGFDVSAIVADARSAGDPASAIAAYREALKRAPLDHAAWQGITTTAVGYQPTDGDAQTENLQLREFGAINAYLTAADPAEGGQALDLLGQGYEAAQNWKLSIKAYRKSLVAAETADVRGRLDAVVAAHGFRIVDNSVDNNAASPRICLNFSDALSAKLTQSENAGDYLNVDGGETLPVTASGSQICVDGVQHGQRYRIVARPGITSSDGETLARQADISVYVRDRDPSVRFATNAYVLPAGGEATIPVTTINTDTIDARLQRIGDRALARAIGDETFLKQLSNYQFDDIAGQSGEDIWKGTVSVASRTNEEVTTAIPVSAIVDQLKPGVYVLSAKAKNGPQYQDSVATQWFVVSDIGLTTFAAEDGFHVFARSLGTAKPLAGVTLQLVAANNQILGTATSDAAGHARLPRGLLSGNGGDRPAVLTAERKATVAAAGHAGNAATGSEAPTDFVFLDMSQSPFDLTDRGVDGRPPAGPLDVFLTSERGIYRTGETAHFTGLVRNATGEAVEGLNLTEIVSRPDGVEHGRALVFDQGAGGFTFGLDLPKNAMRGVWKVALHADPKGPALAEKTVIVEDFQPEKIDFDLTTTAKALDPADPPTVDVAARYLFGAPAGGLEVNGEAVLTTTTGIEAYPGYQFGLAGDEATATRLSLDGATTDADGNAAIGLAAFDPPATTRPVKATLQIRVVDTSGRPVERTLDLPLAGAKPRLAVKPRFDGTVPDGAQAGFDVVAIDASAQRQAISGLHWVLNRVTTDFQWYQTNGNWNYEPVEKSARIASGDGAIGAGGPLDLSMPVDWGQYELVVTDASGASVPASVTFEAGWAVAATSLDTPDMAKVSLDKPRYKVGDKAIVHIEPRFAGTAQVIVMDERIVATRTAEIGADGGDVTLDVTRDWGPGAYVTAIVYRPMDLEAKRMPGRAIGLAHAAVDPGDRALQVSITAPTKIEPRQSVSIDLAVDGVKPGDTAYVTLAAVDVGILNITQFEPPSLSGYYFGKRRLGVEIRDLYSKLIDRMQGAPGTVRSGGDAGGSYESPPPMDELVALFSGLVTVGPDGKANVELAVPDFNGTLKLMALAWSKTGVGEASTDMIVRDPVVMAVSQPLFLSPGDTSRIAIDVTHVEGPVGPASFSLVGGDDIVALGEAGNGRTIEKRFDLAEGQRQRFLIPVSAKAIGEAGFDLALTLPGGNVLDKHFALSVRSNAPETVDKSEVTLAANGGKLDLDPDLFADFVPGTASATVSVTGAAHFDVAGVVRALDRYPYGCTEQITSKAMPLVYLDATTLAAGLGRTEDLKKRVETAIAGVLANQGSNGAFGLWGPDSGDLWLDSYVTDFLTRAKEAGYAVPKEGFDLAIDNLRNNLSYLPEAPDFGTVAYAYYVLARNGRAAIGDLRYYSDNELAKFPPLAKGQIAAALALYGDRMRAETVFRAAIDTADRPVVAPMSRGSYGTPLRDDAAILTLGLETNVDGLDFDPLLVRLNTARRTQRFTSTQEDAWSLLAAHALLDRNPPKLTVSGRDVDGPYSAAFDAADLGVGVDVANRGTAPIAAQIMLRGVPKVAPAASSDGYQIKRSYYTLEGEAANPSEIGQGDRLVAVVEVTPIDKGPAKLMIDDPLPAGFEIDNPAILKGGDVASLDWLELSGEAAHTEFRADRFLAAVDQGDGDIAVRRFAYIVRAVSPGRFVQPAALVQNMYDPSRRGRSDEGQVSVVGPLR